MEGDRDVLCHSSRLICQKSMVGAPARDAHQPVDAAEMIRAPA